MKVAVIGAGFGGLAAAYDLAGAGCQVTVFEADDHVGGLSSGFKAPGWDWSVERYYHHWFASDRHMLGLIDELGWRDKVLFPRPFTVIFHQEAFHPLDSPIAAMRFPGFNLMDIARFGLVTLYLKLSPNWRPLERHKADAWLRRWYGDRVYKIVWQPLLEGKFGPHYREVNAAWFWARVHARTPRLGTFVGGFQAFADALAERVKAEGAALRLNTPVKTIETTPEGGLRLRLPEGGEEFDQCLATVSPAMLAKMAPTLEAGYLDNLRTLKSMGAVVMVLALKHRLSEQGFYWHNLPKAAGFPFLAMVEHTNFLSPENFGGDHIVYCGDYLDPSHEYFSLSQEQLLERFLPSLPRFNSRFTPDWVRQSWLFRTQYAQPVPMVHQSQAIPALKTPMPGLWFASMSQVYPWDRGTNFAVEVGRRAAQGMLWERG
ncbi:MAG: NAD(P)/FAD-dependent oxidoreductase [Anaerolineales bacterium]|jgi:protoporphyrinogen oxidase